MRPSFHVPVTGSRGRAPRELVSHNLANSLSASDGLGAGNPGDSCGSQSRQHPAIAQNKVVFYRFSSTMQHMHRGCGVTGPCRMCILLVNEMYWNTLVLVPARRLPVAAPVCAAEQNM